MKNGDTYQHNFQFTQAQVEAFAKITGDDNPIHLDADYAAGTVFKRPVMHGMLAGSVFSRVFGTLWPGAGTIYLSQSLEWRRPMYVDTNYTAYFEVIALDARRSTATIRTRIIGPDGKETVRGEAVVRVEF